MKTKTNIDERILALAEPIIAQAFLPDASKGDKRILIIDGVAVGAISRVPQPDGCAGA